MPSTSVDQRPTQWVDIAVRSADGRLQLVIEVKNRAGADAAWAAEMRRNLAMHSAGAEAPFFLLALPDHFYLWHNVSPPQDFVLPEYDADPAPLLAPYVGEGLQALVGLSGAGLQLAVSAWISGLVSFGLDQDLMPVHYQWLLDSGLYDAIKGGTALVEAIL
jgi:hypothetical protein